MAPCAQCGNDGRRTFDVVTDGKTYTFDSFECAIHHLAPHCAQCGCRVIGHGIEQAGKIFCCGGCAVKSGKEEIEVLDGSFMDA